MNPPSADQDTTAFTRTVAAVCRIPLAVVEADLSAKEAVRRSGYEQIRDKLTEDHVAAELSQHPELVRAWMVWSEDKRTSSGWYVLPQGARGYEVGYFGRPVPGTPLTFRDPVRAAAAFAIREIAAIADSGSFSGLFR